jgi:23S rRNA pseudouridine1911/1915/1917 synthase
MKRIELQESGLRMDQAITRALTDVSRTEVRKWMDAGLVLLDGKPLRPADKSTAGMIVELFPPEVAPLHVEGEDIPLDIVYEDEWLLAVNKPKGLVVHPGAGNRSGTLVNALIHYLGADLSDLNGGERPGIVHRIDKDTSGLLLVMKDNSAHRKVAAQLARHEVIRRYQALVYGQVAENSGTVIAPLGRDPSNRQRMAVRPDGKKAVTHFAVVARLHEVTHVALELETGRTHQIRVHMQYIGHPVVADPVYAKGRKTYGRTGQLLHAGELCFRRPMTGRWLEITCPLPPDFTQLIQELGAG